VNRSSSLFAPFSASVGNRGGEPGELAGEEDELELESKNGGLDG